jgi:cytochrome c oxidase cbb3-type subunit IV
MIATTLHIIWTLVAFTFFIGVVIWAWSGKRKQDFEALARLPLEDDQEKGVRPQFSSDSSPDTNSVRKIGV